MGRVHSPEYIQDLKKASEALLQGGEASEPEETEGADLPSWTVRIRACGNMAGTQAWIRAGRSKDGAGYSICLLQGMTYQPEPPPSLSKKILLVM